MRPRPSGRVLACLVLATALGAVEPYVAFEQHVVRPSGADPAYTRVDDDTDGDLEGPTRSLQHRHEPATGFRGGLALDETDRVELRGWLFDAVADDGISSAPGGALWDILYFPGNADGAMADSSATAESTIRAWTLDLRWIHAFAPSGPWRAEVSAGLRRSGLRDHFSARYIRATYSFRADHLSDAVGTGIVGGARIRRGWFDDRLGLHAEVSYAVLRGTLISESQHYVEDGVVDVFEFGRDRGSFTQLDAAIGIDAALGAGFTLAADYRIGAWGGMVTEHRYEDTLGGALTTTRDVAWDGFVATVGWAAAF